MRGFIRSSADLGVGLGSEGFSSRCFFDPNLCDTSRQSAGSGKRTPVFEELNISCLDGSRFRFGFRGFERDIVGCWRIPLVLAFRTGSF